MMWKRRKKDRWQQTGGLIKRASERMLSALPRLAILLLGCAVQLHAWAQDPPFIVAWLGDFSGSITFSPANSGTWAYATPNRPLTTGDQVWVDQGSRAELHVGSTALRLSAQTSLAFSSLNDGNVQLKVTQGTISVHVQALSSDQHLEVDTPNVAFVPSQPGSYRIDVDGAGGATKVTVWSGQGLTYGLANGDASNSHVAQAGEQTVYTSTDVGQFVAMTNPPPDRFDQWAAERDASEAQSVSARYVSREVPGYEALDAHGTWISDPSYGYVWAPRVVTADWAPYHDGRWVWIEPWGWTWVDDAPWGFAPYHYGRWAWARARWVWVPGRVNAHPVYAPALVAFVAPGGRRGAGSRISLVGGASGVAWVPLAPGEAYRPGYRVSPRYITQINQTVIINNNNGHNVSHEVLANQHAPNAMAAVPLDTFVHGRPVRKEQARVDTSALKDARFVHTAAIEPAAQSRVGTARPAPMPVAAQRAVVSAHPVVDQGVQGTPEHRAVVPSRASANPPSASNHPLVNHPLVFAPPAAGSAARMPTVRRVPQPPPSHPESAHPISPPEPPRAPPRVPPTEPPGRAPVEPRHAATPQEHMPPAPHKPEQHVAPSSASMPAPAARPREVEPKRNGSMKRQDKNQEHHEP